MTTTDPTAALRDRIAAALYERERPPRDPHWPEAFAADREVFEAMADAVLAVLPPPADRAAVEAPAATCSAWYTGVLPVGECIRAAGHIAVTDHTDDLGRNWGDSLAYYPVFDGPLRTSPGMEVLRRVAAETQTVDVRTLAAALDGLHTLIATSSRDWGTYRVDAWLWAVLVGWDCEQTKHTDTCTHGALEETAAMHGWDAATVAKARRYRAAVRALTEPAVRPVVGEQPDTQEADRIVAYRNPALTKLHCLRCTPHPAGDIWTPVTAGELEDGGICTVCGVDVLIEVKPS